jgi:hypothetical protein
MHSGVILWYKVAPLHHLPVKHNQIYSSTLFALLLGLCLVSCRSSKKEYTLAPPVASSKAVEIPGQVIPTSTPESLVLPPVRMPDDSPTPVPTETASATPGPTETPVPPVVATPVAPLFPLTGIEIASYGDIDQAVQAGAYWVRRNGLIWSVVEPGEGMREWQTLVTLDQELQSISAQGMQAILIVRGTPAWAQKLYGIHCAPMAADKIPAFADFMYDAVTRYSQPPFNVKYWELGNEPDVDPALIPPGSPFGCWGDPADAYYGGGYYAEMLKQVYPAIKTADPQAQVLIGGLLMQCDPDNPPENRSVPGEKLDCSPAKFLEGVLRNGGGDFFDGVSFHAYDYYFDVYGKYGNGSWRSSWKATGPSLIAKTIFLEQLLARYGQADKFLMNTELALLCGVSGNEPPCSQDEWTYTKANHLVQAYTAGATLGLRANIWYSLTGWRGSGLVDPYRQPVPAFQALAFNRQMLQGAIPWGEITLYEGVMGFAFQHENRLVWVLWSRDGLDHSIPLGSLPGAIYNVFGVSLPPELNFTVTLSPVYIEW